MAFMKPCPQCGVRGAVTVTYKLVAYPLGTHSLSGSQMKCSAAIKALLECGECDLKVYGHLEDAVMRGDTFVGGHFVADRMPVMAP